MRKKFLIIICIISIFVFFGLTKYIENSKIRRANEDFLIMCLYTNSSNALQFIKQDENEIAISSKILIHLNELDETMHYATTFLSNDYYNDVFTDFTKNNLNFNNDYLVKIKKNETGEEARYMISVLENLKEAFEKAYNEEENLKLKDIFIKTKKILIRKDF